VPPAATAAGHAHRQAGGQQRQALQARIGPLLAEQQQLDERLRQQQQRLQELGAELGAGGTSDQQDQQQLLALESEAAGLKQELEQEQRQAQDLAEALALQQRTRTRLEQEQVGLEREIARIESRREPCRKPRHRRLAGAAGVGPGWPARTGGPAGGSGGAAAAGP